MVFIGGLSMAIVTAGHFLVGKDVSAILLRKPVITPWFVITEQEIFSGATIPADTNVVFHLPLEFGTIDRQILLGQQGKNIRYWGYCFPENYDPKLTSGRTGFPGKMFLSEKERAARNMQSAAAEPQFSLQNLPTKSQLERLQNPVNGTIRHQIEVFKAGMLCYIMTEREMAIGLDEDGDTINNKLEAEKGTDVSNPDTDGDGLSDGIEMLHGTDPTLRDTDADGIIDGIEDRDWNGRIGPDETDPRNKDTDRDDLCDGMCRIRLSNGQQLYAGEDKNLNGVLDDKETDPLKVDSEGDGYGDYQRFLRCLLDGGSDC